MKLICIKNMWRYRKGDVYVYEYKLKYIGDIKVVMIMYDQNHQNDWWYWSSYEYFSVEKKSHANLYYYGDYFVSERKLKLNKLEVVSNQVGYEI